MLKLDETIERALVVQRTSLPLVIQHFQQVRTQLEAVQRVLLVYKTAEQLRPLYEARESARESIRFSSAVGHSYKVRHPGTASLKVNAQMPEDTKSMGPL